MSAGNRARAGPARVPQARRRGHGPQRRGRRVRRNAAREDQRGCPRDPGPRRRRRLHGWRGCTPASSRASRASRWPPSRRTGAQALEAVRATRPDLVLLDIYLPDMSWAGGAEAASASQRPASAVDVIVISAARDLDTLRTGAARRGLPVPRQTVRDRVAAPVACSEYAAHRADLRRVRRRCARTMWTACSAPMQRPGGPSLPKGISPETTDLVLKALERRRRRRACPQPSAPKPTGLSRSSTRRYLEHLVSIGTAEMRPRYGAAGRPERRYRVR